MKIPEIKTPMTDVKNAAAQIVANVKRKKNCKCGEESKKTGSAVSYVPTADRTAETAKPQPMESGENERAQRFAAAASASAALRDRAAVPEASIGRLSHVDESAQRELLRQLTEAQEKRAANAADYTVEKGVTALERAKEDAAASFQSERDRITAEERQALDNQALYAEARGDRGGIGRAQYASVQNTAAVNRARVNAEQKKLATDTARQIADLRAQGEFEKADKLLDIAQDRLSELMSLGRWAAQTNVGIDEFNAKLDEWEADYALSAKKYATETLMSAANLTGALPDGTPTRAAADSYNAQLAAAGKALLERGIRPTEAQLRAMGWTKAQYEAYVAAGGKG